MGFFTRSTSKQTAKLKSLVKIAVTRLAFARRPRLGRRCIARGDVAQLLSIGHLDRALLRAAQVIEEDDMLEVLDTIEHYCRIVIEQATQLDNPKECSEEIKAAAAGLIFASARCGDLPELLDARAILADKFGRDFARAAKEGANGVVDPTLVRKFSGGSASAERQRRLAKEIAAEKNISLDFPGDENPREVRGRQRLEDDGGNAASVAQLGAEEKVLRESKNYFDVRMAAEAAFESASFAAMAARAAVELSRTSESQGKPGWRGSGHDKVHPVQNAGATGRETRPSWKAQKPLSPSPSWSDMSTVSSVGSDAPKKGKSIVFKFNQSDEEGGEVAEEISWNLQLSQLPHMRTASTTGIGGSKNTSRHAPLTHTSELGGGNALQEARGQRGQYTTPPYKRNPTPNADSNSDAPAPPAEDRDSRRPRLQGARGNERGLFPAARCTFASPDF